MEIVAANTEQTQKFAQEIALKLKPGNTVALYGDLGAGKTTFIQNLAKRFEQEGKKVKFITFEKKNISKITELLYEKEIFLFVIRI